MTVAKVCLTLEMGEVSQPSQAARLVLDALGRENIEDIRIEEQMEFTFKDSSSKTPEMLMAEVRKRLSDNPFVKDFQIELYSAAPRTFDRAPMKVTVVIPTKNEEKTIGEIIDGVMPFCDEVLLIDGHSIDGTREIAERRRVRVILDSGKGKGAALRLGIIEAKGDVLVFIDADGSHDPRDIPKLTRPILNGEKDHVGGSRMLGGSEELYGTLELFARQLGSAIITIGINWICKTHITDSQNGFRAIRRDVALKLGLKENKHTIEEEMLIKTLRRGFRYAEVPTHERMRKHGESKIKLLRDGPRFVYVWLKYLLFVK